MRSRDEEGRLRRKTGEKSELSELEATVLGIIARDQPATAYAIRGRLKESLSSYWSASAGAVYPLLRRLEERAWIRAEEHAFGSRVRREYRLTRTGRRRLREWARLIPETAVTHTYDPVRVRVISLAELTEKDQDVFLEESIRRTREVLAAHEERLEEARPGLSVFSIAGRRGAILELKARLQWLRETRSLIRKRRRLPG